jgi:hypothetical protein
LSKIETLS